MLKNTSSAPTEMDPEAHGAGGVPVRTETDLAMLHAHSRLGNHPLMRCYSGTRDTMRWAPMLARTINNAWCAIPLFWYTQLDGRSARPLREAIPETQALMRWHAEHGIPVEMNESHHWSLRDAPDVVAVVAAYLAAYNARAAGVRDYVQQLMFNNPPNTSPTMDLGKMLAKLELVESLQNEHFRVWRETRGGLTSYPPDPSVARGHLAATVALQMQLKPHIVHIVGHTEAHHATTAAELIEACRIADGVISQCLLGLPDMTARSRRAAKEEGTAGRCRDSARRHRCVRARRGRSVHRCRTRSLARWRSVCSTLRTCEAMPRPAARLSPA